MTPAPPSNLSLKDIMMTTHHDRHYKAGGDPRTLADFMALRAEMNKLSHPARPDINWPYAEQLARGLLEHHGADLRLSPGIPWPRRPAGRGGRDQ